MKPFLLSKGSQLPDQIELRYDLTPEDIEIQAIFAKAPFTTLQDRENLERLGTLVKQNETSTLEPLDTSSHRRPSF